jgi:hypothetical protein
MPKKDMQGVAGWAFRVELLPPDDRTVDSIACLGRWNLTLPGQSILWDRYMLAVVHLRDFPCMQPAIKEAPGMTHEIMVFAIDPKYPEVDFEDGGAGVLEPVNHVCQFVAASDSRAVAAAEFMVYRLVNGQEFAEPAGIMGARDRFKFSVRSFLAE